MAKNRNTVANSSQSGAGLGDTELVLLARGGRRSDRLIDIPETMKAITRQRAAVNLIKRGLVEERVSRAGEPVWREQGDERIALAITAAGLATIGIEPEPVSTGEGAGGPGEVFASAAPSGLGQFDALHPRAGTKGALLVTMLSRAGGASIDELIAATGWLPHTTRAALTGLRKRGFVVDRDQDDGRSRYRIRSADPEPAPAKADRRGRKTRPDALASAA